MEIILEKALPHQQRAVDAVSGVFAGVAFMPPQQFYANPKVMFGSRRCRKIFVGFRTRTR